MYGVRWRPVKNLTLIFWVLGLGLESQVLGLGLGLEAQVLVNITASGSGRSPAAKRYLVNFRLKISPLVATIFSSFSGNETSNWGGLDGWVVTYMYLTFMVDCWSYGVRIPVGKRNLFVYIYRPYLINAMLLYVEFMCVLTFDLHYSTLMHLEAGRSPYYKTYAKCFLHQNKFHLFKIFGGPGPPGPHGHDATAYWSTAIKLLHNFVNYM